MNRGFRKTLFSVFLAHLVIIVFLYFSEGKALRKPFVKNIAINTITVNEPLPIFDYVNNTSTSTSIPEEKISSSNEMDQTPLTKPPQEKKKNEKAKATPKENEIKKKNESKPKSVTAKKPSETSIKKNTPVSKKSSPKPEKGGGSLKNYQSNNELVSKKLLDELQRDLSFIEKPLEESKKASNLKVPNLSSLEITGLKSKIKQNGSGNFSGKVNASLYGGSSSEAEFKGVLIDFFKRELKLPDYGDVKIKMKINESGNISDISVLSSKNKKNEEYLKSTLLKMSIPWLNKYLSKRDEVDITVCFTNDI